jgi:methyltransferase
MMSGGGWLVLFLVAQRLAELIYAYGNTRRLLADGAREFGRAHYPAIVALHAFWIMSLWVFGQAQPVNRWWLGVFILLQVARAWTVESLGRRWTTRVIVVPGEPPVVRGPYRWLRHPNYAIVVLEIAVVPLALGLPLLAAIFSLANAAVLWHRIRVENTALAWASGASRSPVFRLDS